MQEKIHPHNIIGKVKVKVPLGWGMGVGLTTLPCKKENY
jgi:hypothetical protein